MFGQVFEHVTRNQFALTSGVPAQPIEPSIPAHVQPRCALLVCSFGPIGRQAFVWIVWVDSCFAVFGLRAWIQHDHMTRLVGDAQNFVSISQK